MRARYPLFYKISAASFLVVTVVLAFLGLVSWRDQKMALEDKFGLTLQHVAQTAALFLDGDAHQRVHSNADAAGEEFQKLRGVLDRVRRENSLREDQIYTLRPRAEGGYAFVVMLQEKTFIADSWVPPAEPRRVIEWVMKDGTPRYSHLYTDEHGTYVSAWAPIRDSGGKIVSVLEVDFGVDQFLAALKRDNMRRMWIYPGALAIALLLSLLVARSITVAVRRLVEGTDDVREGRYDRTVEVRTRDELRTLADAFNDMLRGLRERFAMLKFVPRHTRVVIAKSVEGADDINLAQRREVAVFFSDIRGFTTISDKLPPARVIEMLNIYVRKEAEILERHGGSIDKYIGDAVMAVFEGDNRFRAAIDAAVEIQRTMAALNQSKAFEVPIHVGIGIAGGEVVMGAVGYEDRLEFAVIGRMVNLASRLTSTAAAGEIVVSEAAAQALDGRYASERLEGLKLKGFADAVTCYKVKSESKGVAA